MAVDEKKNLKNKFCLKTVMLLFNLEIFDWLKESSC